MADNVLRKPSHKVSSATADDTGSPGQMPTRKISAPVHRTTTETIRLGEPIDNTGKLQHHHHHGQSLGSVPVPANNSLSSPANNAQNRTKKTSSFQITSVTVGCRMSNDAGEDSNDDLDESHTEDNSVDGGHSRLTDIETPSYSEDTFSKDDVFFNASNAALSTAPVIPTSSQYGLAIVPSSEANNANSAVNENNINTLDITSVTDNNIINLLSSNAKQDADLREVHSHGRNERFKVVKIESTEPFKRGRWTCMDYLDHTSVNQPTAKVSDPNEVCISYGVTDTGIVIPDSSNKQVLDDKGMPVDSNGHMHPEMQQQHSTMTTGGYAIPGQQPPQQQQQPPQQQQQQQQVPPQYFQSSTSQSQQQQQQQQPQQTPAQGATLPTNLQPAHPNNLGQTQSMPQGAIPILTQQGCPVSQASTAVPQQQPQQNIAHPTDETQYVPVSSQAQAMPPQAQTVCQTNASAPQTSQAPTILVSQQQAPLPTSQPQSTQMPESITAMQGMQGMQSIHKVPQPSAAPPQQQQQQQPPPQQLQPQSQMIAQSGQMQQGPPQQQAAAGTTAGAPVQMMGGMQQGSIAFHQQPQQQQQQQQQQPPQQSDTEQDSMSGMVVTGTTAGQSMADAALLESLAEVTQNADDLHSHDDNESMSGTSAVAIDNKIEQAMDLVKSHLMFAVREEVEVLKEKIAELMDRINQLEAENSILKAHATPETLAQLSQTAAKLPLNNSGSGQ